MQLAENFHPHVKALDKGTPEISVRLTPLSLSSIPSPLSDEKTGRGNLIFLSVMLVLYRTQIADCKERNLSRGMTAWLGSVFALLIIIPNTLPSTFEPVRKN